MRKDGLRGELAVAKSIEHGCMCAQVAAPAHADSRKYGDGIAVDDALCRELGNKAQRCTHSTKRRDGEGHQRRVGEAEEPLEDDVYMAEEPWQEGNTLIGSTIVCAIIARAKCENHNKRRDDKNARDDRDTHVDTRLTAIEQRIEDAREQRCLLDLLVGLHVGLVDDSCHLILEVGVALDDEALHEARRYDTAEERAQETYEGLDKVTLRNHEDDNQQTHAEGCAKVCERDELELLEVRAKALILSQRDNRGVVRQEGHDSTQRCHARKVEQRLHQGAQDALQEAHNTKLHEDTAKSTSDNADGHEVEDGIEQQVVCRLHNGIKHIRKTHDRAYRAEDADNNNKAEDTNEVLADALLFILHILRLIRLFLVRAWQHASTAPCRWLW